MQPSAGPRFPLAARAAVGTLRPMETARTTVALVGLGGWGPNLLRCAAQCASLDVRAVCDADAARAEVATRLAPGARFTTALEDVVSDDRIAALLLATPAGLHEEHARRALEAGKHVLVEKPIAMSTAGAESLAWLAASRGLRLMAGHTFLYSGAVRALQQLVDGGELGRLGHVSAERLSLGSVREDVNVWWNLAPHDVSILLALFGELPSRVRATGSTLLPGARHPDIVTAVLEFPGGRGATIHVSWLNPLKVRRLTLLGDKNMVLYDDVAEQKLVLYDKGVDSAPVGTGEGGFAEFRRRIRRGGERPVEHDRREPLAVELQEFADCIREGREALTGPAEAVAVVRVLEACQRSLDNDGQPVAP